MALDAKGGLESFEQNAANIFGFEAALYFPMGRGALFALLRALDWRGKSIVVPAYTCVVVPHAISLSGNMPVFMDSAPDHFNAPSSSLKSVLSPDTAMVIPTPVFGYPLDRQGYREAQGLKCPEAFVLYDAAHGFAVRDDKGPQWENADGALLGLGIGKLISTLQGGLLLLRDSNLAREVAKWRDYHLSHPRSLETIRKFFYGAMVYMAFREPLLGISDRLERDTRILSRFTEHYYGKTGISLPDDVHVLPTALQAGLGLSQLRDYSKIISERRRTAEKYDSVLSQEGFVLFASSQGGTYSHFPLPVADRARALAGLRKLGVQAGKLIDYACPDLPGYEPNRGCYPHATWFGGHVINLPIWKGIGMRRVGRVLESVIKLRDLAPEIFDINSPFC